MSGIIKQISVYNGNSWEENDIGANASNIDLNNTLVGGNNIQSVLNNILPVNPLTKDKVVITDSEKKLSTSNVSITELGYLSGLSSPIQTQLEGKAPATAITSISRSGLNFTATRANGQTFTFNQQDTWLSNTRDQAGYVAAGSGNANKVWKTDANGVPGWRVDADTNTTYSVATTSTSGLMSAADKTKLNGIATSATKITTLTTRSIQSNNVSKITIGANTYVQSTHYTPGSNLAANQKLFGILAFGSGNVNVGITNITDERYATSESTGPIVIFRNFTGSSQEIGAGGSRVFYIAGKPS